MIRRLLVVACLSLVVGVGCELVLDTDPPDWPAEIAGSVADGSTGGPDAGGGSGGDGSSVVDGGADASVEGDGGSETSTDGGGDSSDAGDDGPDASSQPQDAGADGGAEGGADGGADAGGSGSPDAGASACAGMYEGCTDRPCCLGLGCDVTGGAWCKAVITEGLPNGYACNSSGECMDGYCKNRVCTAPDSNNCAGAGWYCGVRTCCADPKLDCLAPFSPGTCALPSGEPCLYSSMCLSLNCQEGHCAVSQRAQGAACDEDLSCESGHCGTASHVCEPCIATNEPCKSDGSGGYENRACCSRSCGAGLCE